MKKVFMTLAAVAAFSFANAQLFVGGSLGFSSQSGKTNDNYTTTVGSLTTSYETEYKSPSSSEFVIAPKVGFYLNEKLAVGASLIFDRYSKTEFDYPQLWDNNSEVENSYKNIGTAFGIAPFVRYHFAEWNNLSLFGELTVGMMWGNTKDVATVDNKETTLDGPKTFAFGVSLTPGVAYKINEHIQLEATLDVFGLNYMYEKMTETTDEEILKGETVVTNSSFNFGVDSESLFNVGQLTVGFVYKF